MVVTYQHTRCPQASDLEINQYTPRYIARRLLTRQESPPLRSEALVRAKFIGMRCCQLPFPLATLSTASAAVTASIVLNRYTLSFYSSMYLGGRGSKRKVVMVPCHVLAMDRPILRIAKTGVQRWL